MRYRDITCLAQESYTNDTVSVDATLLDPNTYLEVGDFKEESEQLARQFKIKDHAVSRAVRRYTERSSINAQLIARHGDPTELPSTSKRDYDLLVSLKGVAIEQTHHVYCGTGVFNPLEVVGNGTIEIIPFLSSSLSIRVAAKTSSYRRVEARSHNDHVMHIVLTKGFKGGFYIAPYSHDPEELEFLIFPAVRLTYAQSRIIELDGVTREIHTFHAEL